MKKIAVEIEGTFEFRFKQLREASYGGSCFKIFFYIYKEVISGLTIYAYGI
jgi:hypothetical protein